MSGLINQSGAKSGIIQGYQPYRNANPENRVTSGMTYERHNRTYPNYDRPGDGPYTPDIYTSCLIRSDSTNNNTHFSDFGSPEGDRPSGTHFSNVGPPRGDRRSGPHFSKKQVYQILHF